MLPTFGLAGSVQSYGDSFGLQLACGSIFEKRISFLSADNLFAVKAVGQCQPARRPGGTSTMPVWHRAKIFGIQSWRHERASKAGRTKPRICEVKFCIGQPRCFKHERRSW